MSLKYGAFLCILACWFPQAVKAQSSNLEKYIQQGLQQNLQLQKNNLAVEKQTYKVKEAKSNRLPVVTFDPSYILALGGRRLEFPIGDLFNPAYQALNELTQTSDFPTDLANLDEQLTPNNFHDTRVYASMPIYNPAIYYNLKAQEQLISVEQAKINAYEVELKKEIKVAYYNYFKTFEVLKVLEASEKLLKEVYRFNQKLVKYDKATIDVLSGVKFEIAQLNSNRANVINQQIVAKAYFNSLLNRNFDTAIAKDEPMRLSKNTKKITQLRKQALNKRPELNQIQEAIKATKIVTEIKEKNLLPTVGVQASAGFQGNGYKFKDQSVGTIALGAKWTIYDGKKRKYQIEQSKIETQELEQEYTLIRQQIELQVVNAWHTLQAAEQKVVANQAAVESATTNFNLINKRYKNEKAILIELLDAQTKLVNAQIQLSIAQYDVLIKEAELERAVVR